MTFIQASNLWSDCWNYSAIATNSCLDMWLLVTESDTENIPPVINIGKGEKVR